MEDTTIFVLFCIYGPFIMSAALVPILIPYVFLAGWVYRKFGWKLLPADCMHPLTK